MSDAPPDLVALVGSRMAHDLANPLGAIANGVELLGLTGQADGPELALITESVENATARIKAFRIAFGAAAPGQTIPEAEMRALVRGGLDRRGLTVDWRVPGGLPRSEARLAMLALMCFETALPRGGHITVTIGAGQFHLVAEAEHLRVDPATWAHLAGNGAEAPLSPANVHFALLPRFAAEARRSIDVEAGAHRLALRV